MSQGVRRDRCFRRLIQGCVRFGNLDLDLKIRLSDLRSNAISKRIPTLRYLFLDFHLYRSIGKSEKRFEKLSLRTAVLILFTITVLQILLRISQSNGKYEIHEIRIWISRRWNPFSDFAFDCKIRNPHFQSKSWFSSRAQPLMYFTSTYGHCIHESKQCCYLKTTTQQ